MDQVRHIQTKFEFFDLSHIPRSENTHANSLATLTISSTQDLPRVILVEDLCTPTPMKRDLLQVHQIKVGSSWMDPIQLFLEKDILPEEKLETEKVRGQKVVQALFFWTIFAFCTSRGIRITPRIIA